jgi:hypothetical protein
MGFCLLEVPEVVKVMRCVLLCILKAVEDVFFTRGGGLGGSGGDASCAPLYAGGYEERALFAGGAGGDVLYATMFAVGV